jgi:phenylpropionate dioxygenase-like ring-hydroxylating dioxygenase large terminal subunit
MAADPNRNALLEASRTPGYRKVKRVAPEQSPQTPAGKAPDPDLGHAVVRKERYTSAEFMKLEWERMWQRVWLLGGLETDLSEPGDYVCTEIGRESVLLVRQADGGVRAFYNVCMHRGNRLRAPGVGSTETFKCQYHHWEYALDGAFKRIPDLDTFPQGAPPCRGPGRAAVRNLGRFRLVQPEPESRAAARVPRADAAASRPLQL